MKITSVHTKNFAAWSAFFGCVVPNDGDERFPSALWGFENVSCINRGKRDAVIPSLGACYGFVQTGQATLTSGGSTFIIKAGGYFSTRCGMHLVLEPESRVFVCQRFGFTGMTTIGQTIEEKGRLRYIDSCSDTLLVAPAMRGDACFNHLHFPTGIDQTEHTHPSTRFGMVARGKGECETPHGICRLTEGLLFWIPKDGLHRFRTAESHMDVIAYHPDSDFGPTHEDHPMVNRTHVDGMKIDNHEERHLHASVVMPYFPIAPDGLLKEEQEGVCPKSNR